MSKNITPKHKRSTTSGSIPTASSLQTREFGINTADKSLFFKTPAGSVIELSRDLFSGSTAPTSPLQGDVWYDTSNKIFKLWNSSSWIPLVNNGPTLQAANFISLTALTGSGTLASPLKHSSAFSVKSGSHKVLDTFTVSNLTPGQIVNIFDTVSNSGRFYPSTNTVDVNGNLVFSLIFNDSPPSSKGTTFTSTLNVGGVYLEVSVLITRTVSDSSPITTPINTLSTKSVWVGSSTSVTSTGDLLISLDGVSWSQGPLTINTGYNLYTKWSGSPGSGTGIDSANGTTITGTLTESTYGGQTSVSLTVDKVPNSFSFVDQTGVSISTDIYSNSISILGTNSYSYITSTGTGELYKNGGLLGTLPSSSSPSFYVVNGDSIQVSQQSSSSYSTATNLLVDVSGTSDTFTVTTASPGSVNTPTITSPVAASSVSSKSTITSSAYSISGTPGSHLNTDWEIYSDSTLTTLVASSLADSTNLTSWTPSGLQSSTSYWVRVKHRSSSLVESSWSPAVQFTTIGLFIAVAHGTSPYISVYPWTGSFGTRVSDPATLPTGSGRGIAFSPSDSHIAVAHGTSPFISVYPWTGSFGAKVANPSTLPAGNGNGVAFSPSGSHIAVSHFTTPYISVYPWTGAFGAKVADPATLPTGTGSGVAFSPSGSHIAVAHNTTPFISVYPWTGSFGAKVANPTTLPTGNGIGVAFSPSGSHIAVAHNTTPFISVYPWTGSFGAKVANPATLPTGLSSGVTFSPA